MDPRSKEWREVPDDPPDDRPELSAGATGVGEAIIIHETGDPATWIKAEETVDAPDFEE
jgi:hypothetical protein